MIREDVAAIDLPASRFDRVVEGGAVDFGARRQADFRQHHAVAAKCDALGVHRAMDGLAEGGGLLIEMNVEMERLGIFSFQAKTHARAFPRAGRLASDFCLVDVQPACGLLRDRRFRRLLR